MSRGQCFKHMAAAAYDRAAWDANPVAAFTEGIRASLGMWDVLNMAIDGGWGDSAEYDPEEQREQLVDMLVELFTMNTDTLEAYDVEDYLTNVMHENYSTEVDDGSLQMVSKLLATMYVDVTKKKDFAGLIKVLDRYSKTGKWRAQAVQANKQDDDSSDDEPEALVAASAAAAPVEDVEMPEVPKVDPDGWETVQSGRKKKGGKR